MRVIQPIRRLLSTSVRLVTIALAMDFVINVLQEDMAPHLVLLTMLVMENANQAISANQEAPPRFNLHVAMRQYIALKLRLIPSLSTMDTIQHLKFIRSLPTMPDQTQRTIFNASAKWGTGVTTASSITVLKERMGLRLDQAT